MIELANGSVVEDPRLGRLPQPDARNANFPVRELISPAQAKKRRGYTWACEARLDQGSIGACTGFAVAHEGASKPAVVKAVDNATALALYRRAQQLDAWPGEDYEGSSVLAAMKAGAERGWYSEYRWAFTVEDAVLAVGYKGPGVAGLNWYSDMMKIDLFGFVRVSGSLLGGHAILVNGVDVKNERFRLTNSWGRSWGWNGQAWISFADFGRLLREAGELAIPSGRKV